MKVKKGIEIEVVKGVIYLHLAKHMPFVVNAGDKYRKGIKFDYCHSCKELKPLCLYINKNEEYCDECGLKRVKDKNAKQQPN